MAKRQAGIMEEFRRDLESDFVRVEQIKLGKSREPRSGCRTIDTSATRTEVAALLGQPVMGWRVSERTDFGAYEHGDLVIFIIFEGGLVSDLYLEKSVVQAGTLVQ